MKVVVIGGGGHAGVVIDILRLQGADLVGIIDPDPGARAATLMNLPVLGDDRALSRLRESNTWIAIGIGGTGPGDSRRRSFAHARAAGLSVCSVIHPSAVIATNVTLGDGVHIMAGAIIQTGCRVGHNTIVNTGAIIDHDCEIGDHVHIAPGAVLSGGVIVEDGAHIGTGACLIQLVRIGSGAMVAAGAVVVGSVPPGAVVMGVPAREQVT